MIKILQIQYNSKTCSPMIIVKYTNMFTKEIFGYVLICPKRYVFQKYLYRPAIYRRLKLFEECIFSKKRLLFLLLQFTHIFTPLLNYALR